MHADFVIDVPAGFEALIPADAKVETLADGFQFVEGPVWSSREGGFLLFSDIPASRIYRYTHQTGARVWRDPSDHANGNTRDREGRLITCEHGTRTVTRTDDDGRRVTLAASYQGKRLNSPNDAVVKNDGTIWFTDPPYGLKNQLEGKELDKQHVFRLDPETLELTSVVDDFVRPNGLCFSPDFSKLYIADTQLRHIRVFTVNPDNTLSGGEIFCTIDVGGPDGIRCDETGNLWSTAGDGVHIFAPDGRRLGKILTPLCDDPKNPGRQIRLCAANLCFGGPDHKTLFITARTSLYSISVAIPGAEKF